MLYGKKSEDSTEDSDETETKVQQENRFSIDNQIKESEKQFNEIFGWINLLDFMSKQMNKSIEEVEQMNIIEFHNMFYFYNEKIKLENKKLLNGYN